MSFKIKKGQMQDMRDVRVDIPFKKIGCVICIGTFCLEPICVFTAILYMLGPTGGHRYKVEHVGRFQDRHDEPTLQRVGCLGVL